MLHGRKRYSPARRSPAGAGRRWAHWERIVHFLHAFKAEFSLSFLFSTRNLQHAFHFTGWNEATALTVLSVFFFSRGKSLSAGIAAGIGMMFSLVAGAEYVQQVYLFHLFKNPDGIGGFLLLLARPFPQYFLILTPFLSLLAAWSIAAAVQLWKEGRSALSTSLLIALFSLAVLSTLRAGMGFIHSTSSPQGDFQIGYDVAQYLQEKTPLGGTLYGDFGIAPTVALLSGRRIAAHELESTPMRFDSGRENFEDIIPALEADGLSVIILSPESMMRAFPPFTSYLTENFILEAVFRDGKEVVEVWGKKL